ncbi:MAG TPA: condensation domain-containing protein [Terriglobales bacterium]|nr:condensation domain-containing protein [Terriglobales bacterium]
MSSSATPQPEPILEPRKPEDPRLISYTQRRLWYLDQLTPGTGVYNVPYAMRVHGPLNVEALQNAINKVIERHEVLRTVFLAPGGNPVPVLLKKFNAEIKQYDLRHHPDREAEAERITNLEAARPFNFARDLMFRAALVRLSDDDWILIHVAHHIATEFGSTALIYGELTPLYEGFLTGAPVTLPPPKIQYADFCLWQHRFLQGERLERLTNYWKQQLAGAATLNLPTDKPRPAVSTLRGTRYPMVLPPEQFVAIARLSKASGTTPFRGTCAAFDVFLQAYTGQDDISLGSPIAPRTSPGNYGAIGFFVNTLVLRSDLSGNPTFRELMLRVHKVVQGAIDNADLTFDKLVEALKPPREAGRMPLFQVNFRILKAPVPALELKGLEITPPRFVDTHTAKFDLAMELEATTGKSGFFEYSTDLFERSTIAQMAKDFEAVLSALIADPDTPIQNVPAVREISQRMRARRTKRD